MRAIIASVRVLALLLFPVAMVVPAAPRKYVSERQVAQTYGISMRTVHRYVAQGRLKAYRVGPKLVRFDADEVERALVGNR
jgi:excisionase family DNA binding protein